MTGHATPDSVPCPHCDGKGIVKVDNRKATAPCRWCNMTGKVGHAIVTRVPNFKKPNPRYLKVREIASRAVWMLDNRILDIEYEGDLPTDIAAVVLKVVRDEIEALIHTGAYYGPGEADVDSLDFYDVLGLVSDG